MIYYDATYGITMIPLLCRTGFVVITTYYPQSNQASHLFSSRTSAAQTDLSISLPSFDGRSTTPFELRLTSRSATVATPKTHFLSLSVTSAKCPSCLVRKPSRSESGVRGWMTWYRRDWEEGRTVEVDEGEEGWNGGKRVVCLPGGGTARVRISRLDSNGGYRYCVDLRTGSSWSS